MEGKAEGQHEAVVRLTIAMLRRRFGDDPRITPAAERLAQLPDDERLTLMDEARDLADLG